MHFLKNKLRRRVIDVPWEVVTLQKLFEVEGHSNGVEFTQLDHLTLSSNAETWELLDPTRMDVSMDDPKVMKDLQAFSDRFDCAL